MTQNPESYFEYLRSKKWGAFDFLEALLLLYPFKILFQVLFDTKFRIKFYTTPFGYALFIIFILIAAMVFCFVVYMYFKYHKERNKDAENKSAKESKLRGSAGKSGKFRVGSSSALLLFTLLLYLTVAAVSIIETNGQNNCVLPSSEKVIEDSTLFCQGTYPINGIIISGENIFVDCNNATLIGPGSSKGIRLENSRNVKLKNCNIEGYDIALYIKNTTTSTIEHNSFSKSRIGVRLYDSYENVFVYDSVLGNNINIDMINAKFNSLMFDNINLEASAFCSENSCDSLYAVSPCIDNDGYCGSICTQLLDNDCAAYRTTGTQDTNQDINQDTAVQQGSTIALDELSPELALEYYEKRMQRTSLEILNRLSNHEEAKRRIRELIENGKLQAKTYVDPDIREALFKQLGITNEQYQAALKEIYIKKYVYVAGNRTIFEITIVAKGKTENLVLYEYFPEELESLALPALPENTENAKIEKHDNYFKIFLGEMDVDASTKVEFSAGKNAFFKQLPTTIPTADSAESYSGSGSNQLNLQASKEAVGLSGNTKTLSFWLQLVFAYLCSFFFTQYVKYRIKIRKPLKNVKL